MELLHEVLIEGVMIEMFPYEGDDYPNHFEALFYHDDTTYHILFSPAGLDGEQPIPLKILSCFSDTDKDLVESSDTAELEDIDRWERELLAQLDIKEEDFEFEADEDDIAVWDATLEDGLDDTYYSFEEEE